MINFKKNVYSLIILFFVFILVSIIIHQIIYYSTNEIIIPQIKTKDGGIQKKNKLNKPVVYYNELNDIKKSDIKLSKSIRYNQSINRYMKISGKVDLNNLNYNSDQYRSVIIEVRPNNDYRTRLFYTIPLKKSNYFSGYIYFKNKGLNKISCYLFYDYLSNYGRKKIKFVKKTTASAGFFVNVLEGVPEDLTYLLPTKNVDCGNKKLRKLSLRLTKHSKTNIEKAKTIYEYLVFGNNKRKDKYKFSKYKDTYKVYNGNNFYNAYTASQILESKSGICNDFAEVYAAMMRSLGYKIKKVSGYIDENKEVGHMWNIINLNRDENEWLKVDASWGNVNKINYKKWADFYPEFDETFFEESFKPYNHSAFSFESKVEY